MMSVLPGKLNYIVWRDSTFRESFILRDSTSSPTDLTGYEAIMEIKDGNCIVLFTLSTTNGRITLGGVTGTVDLFISAADTDFDLDAMTYEFSIIGPGPTDDRDFLLYGDFLVKDSC